MRLEKQVKDWEQITKRYQEYKQYEFINCDEKEDCVQEIQCLIKRYVVNYGVCYDPVNPPIKLHGDAE